MPPYTARIQPAAAKHPYRETAPAAKKLIDLCWFSSSPLPVTLILKKNSSLPEM
ncbi:MAG: hypothetical protein U5N58_03065 [Actinomycetota bacterium]|nr:hypothetical protein [Actinomycetota bacterium]